MSTKYKQDETNYQAQRLFMFLSFVMTFIMGLNFLGGIRFIVNDITPDAVYSLFVLMFFGYLIGLYGMFKPQPPLHYAVILASILNFAINLILIFGGDTTALLQASLSFLIVYLGVRFPIEFGDGEVTFNIT